MRKCKTLEDDDQLSECGGDTTMAAPETELLAAHSGVKYDYMDVKSKNKYCQVLSSEEGESEMAQQRKRGGYKSLGVYKPLKLYEEALPEAQATAGHSRPNNKVNQHHHQRYQSSSTNGSDDYKISDSHPQDQLRLNQLEEPDESFVSE